MSEPQHTPGSWKFSTETHFSGGAPYSESVYVTMGENTLTIGCHTGSPYRETLEANALLIAAAPDLLDALLELVDIVEGIREGDYTPDSFTLQPAKTAIAKATKNAILSPSKTPEQ